MSWTCPLCQAPLQRQGGTLVCPARHSFDIAREGYVNLLPVARKRSRDPGDNPEMIQARRRVHEADVYRPLADSLARVLGEAAGDTAAVLDLGCGEGYYTGVLLEHMPELALYGVDISRAAVRLAARACRGASFSVASAAGVPLPDHSMDAVVSVFAPATDSELRRILRPGGYFLKVWPAAEHLWELRELLYDEPRPHREELPRIAGFSVHECARVDYRVELEGQLLRDLVAMTPYAYGGQRENKRKLEQAGSLCVGMSFRVVLAERESCSGSVSGS